MNNTNLPSNFNLPSTRSLIKSTVVAVCVVVILLFTVILPAEYGIDYTGVGNALGLTRMGEIKVKLAEEAENDRTLAMTEKTAELPDMQAKIIDQKLMRSAVDTLPSSWTEAKVKEDEMTITLQPDEGKEIKLVMNKGDQAGYLWWSDGGKVNFDCHADSKPLNIKYHAYNKGSLQRSEGTLEAAFDGSHGWFWRNRTSEPVTVVLQVKGIYSEIKKI